MPTLLYLHGFNSSPQSKKALETQRWCTENAPQIKFVCPALPPFANQAMVLLQRLVEAELPEQFMLWEAPWAVFLPPA